MRAWFKPVKENGGGDKVDEKKFVEHAYHALREFGELISLLPFPIAFDARATQLAKTHFEKSPRIGKKHFKPLNDKFRQFISVRLEQPTYSEIAKLWARLSGVIYKVIVREESRLGSLSMAMNNIRTKSCCSCEIL